MYVTRTTPGTLGWSSVAAERRRRGRLAGVNSHSCVLSRLDVSELLAVAVVRPTDAASQLAASRLAKAALSASATAPRCASLSSSLGPFTGCRHCRFRLVEIQLVDELHIHENNTDMQAFREAIICSKICSRVRKKVMHTIEM